MKKQILIFEHPQFGKVHGYLNENGTAFFNVEDIARGLGFTQVAKSGNVVIRWERVNKYLNSFGFIPTSGDGIPKVGDAVTKEDFIPENMVYRLAMKANNETAENFQAWLADEVVPSIRKTGSYSLPKVKNAVAIQNPNPLPEYHKIIKIIDKTATQIVKCFGTKYGIAFATVASMIEENHGINLTKIKALIPPADYEIGIYTPTQIGKKIGKSPQYVNKKLVELGLQEKDGEGYKLTDKGKEYAETMPFERNGHAGYQIKWKAEILKFFD